MPILQGMVIVRLCGGLGNQLFQYATGRALALRRNTALAPLPEDDREESIYDTMKTHMARKVEERNAAAHTSPPQSVEPATPAPSEAAPLSFSAQMRAQLAATPRPVPNRPTLGGRPSLTPPLDSSGPPVTIIADLSNLPAVWKAAQEHLAATRAASINTMLGDRAHLQSLTPTLAILSIPSRQQTYAGPKIQARIEESLRAVTAQPGLHLQITTHESDDQPRPNPNAPASTRIAPELLAAIRQTPVIQSLLLKLGGDITQVEPLESPPETP